MYKIKTAIKRKLESALGYEKYPYKNYCDQHECIFIHIPKNAGTSIINLLNGFKTIEQEHNTYWDYLRADDERFENYYKFCVVRNPWDRLFSAYKYLQKGGNQNSDKYLCAQFNSQCNSFENFVLSWLTKDKVYNITVLTPQFMYFYDYHNEKIKVDYILRYESLSNDFKELQKTLNVEGELPWVNKSGKCNYKDYYTEDMISKVRELYSYDIELLKYKY
jgi:hypothetical protein